MALGILCRARHKTAQIVHLPSLGQRKPLTSKICGEECIGRNTYAVGIL